MKATKKKKSMKSTIRAQPRAKGVLKDGSKDSSTGGGCRKFICDILTLRVLRYVIKQPPSCMYIVTLFLVSGCLPFIGLYIANQPLLPDLDAMQNWNAYIGKLGHNVYCFKADDPFQKTDSPAPVNLSSLLPTFPPFNKTISSYPNNYTHLTTCVNIEFIVNKNLVILEGKVKKALLIGNYTGAQVGTQIKSNGRRIDDQIFIHFIISSSSITNITASCSGKLCTLNGTVLITAPPTATPTRLPQVHKDFTFETKVHNCEPRCPASLCKKSLYDQTITPDTEVSVVTKLNECGSETNQLRVVNKHKFGAKVNGIIKIFLNDDDKAIAAYHMYLAAIAVAALSLTFTVGIILTDRPSEPKPSLA